MIETIAFSKQEAVDLLSPDRQYSNQTNVPDHEVHGVSARSHLSRQVLRFGLSGGLNTLVDVLILNGLLWLFPTTSMLTLLAYNSLAYSLGAVNSFLLNKYWTFRSWQKATSAELVRFTLITLCGIAWSSAILWLASTFLRPFLFNATVWANASKVVAIAGTALISYLGMRLWVFVSKMPKEQASFPVHVPANSDVYAEQRAPVPGGSRDTSDERELHPANEDEEKTASNHSISIILPAFNEAYVIGATLEQVLHELAALVKDFEVIVVNDGSADRTGAIVSAIREVEPRVRVITHVHNQGYGSALADGFAAATKELTFFMDSDGQFDIRDLARLLLFIDEYDAVIGYRLARQDAWLRKLNAWAWNVLISRILGIHVNDIDCAFKLLRTDFLHQHPLETRGALINAELLYKLKRVGYTYREVGVHHLPRQGGHATGANLRVIARAFRELFIFARQWRHEERTHSNKCTGKACPYPPHHPFKKGPVSL